MALLGSYCRFGGVRPPRSLDRAVRAHAWAAPWQRRAGAPQSARRSRAESPAPTRFRSGNDDEESAQTAAAEAADEATYRALLKVGRRGTRALSVTQRARVPPPTRLSRALCASGRRRAHVWQRGAARRRGCRGRRGRRRGPRRAGRGGAAAGARRSAAPARRGRARHAATQPGERSARPPVASQGVCGGGSSATTPLLPRAALCVPGRAPGPAPARQPRPH